MFAESIKPAQRLNSIPHSSVTEFTVDKFPSECLTLPPPFIWREIVEGNRQES